MTRASQAPTSELQHSVSAHESWVIETSFSGAYGSDLASLSSMSTRSLRIRAGRAQCSEASPWSNVNGTVIPSFSTATNNYNAFNVRLEKRFSYGLSFLMNYTIQKNLETGGAGQRLYQNGGTSIALDTYNLSRENGPLPSMCPDFRL